MFSFNFEQIALGEQTTPGTVTLALDDLPKGYIASIVIIPESELNTMALPTEVKLKVCAKPGRYYK